MVEILKTYESKIGSISLIPSAGGKFEVKVNDKLAYSKLQTGRHAQENEIIQLVGENL
jgi:selenoprotein W-related protein